MHTASAPFKHHQEHEGRGCIVQKQRLKGWHEKVQSDAGRSNTCHCCCGNIQTGPQTATQHSTYLTSGEETECMSE